MSSTPELNEKERAALAVLVLRRFFPYGLVVKERLFNNECPTIVFSDPRAPADEYCLYMNQNSYMNALAYTPFSEKGVYKWAEPPDVPPRAAW